MFNVFYRKNNIGSTTTTENYFKVDFKKNIIKENFFSEIDFKKSTPLFDCLLGKESTGVFIG